MPDANRATTYIPTFALVRPEDLAAIAAVATRRHYDRGALIVVEGAPKHDLLYLHAGLVKVFTTSPQGREQVVRLVYPGQTFNTAAVLDGDLSPTSAMALEASVVYVTGRAELRRFLLERPEVALAALEALASLLRIMIARIEDLSFSHVKGRVAKLLVEQDMAIQEGRLTHPLTRQEMAAIAGTTREPVCRALKELEATGAIALRRGRVVILSRERLLNAV